MAVHDVEAARRVPGLCWITSKAKSESSSFCEKLCLKQTTNKQKNQMESDQRRHSVLPLTFTCTCLHKCVHTLVHAHQNTCAHTHKPSIHKNMHSWSY